nr:hypothetical protein 13 [bacterium]
MAIESPEIQPRKRGRPAGRKYQNKTTKAKAEEIRQLWIDGHTVAQIARALSMGFTTVSNFVQRDEKTREIYEAEAKQATWLARVEAQRAMHTAVAMTADLLESPQPLVRLKAADQTQKLYDSLTRAAREDEALEAVESRIAAVQEAQAELAHSSAIGILEPVDVEVAPAESAESLPQQSAFMDEPEA